SSVQCDLLVREKHEVMNQNLCGFFQSILRMDGTISSDFKKKLLVIGFLFHTEIFNRELNILDGSKYGVDRNNIQIIGCDTMLICRNITATFVYSQFHLKCSSN